MFEVTTLIVLTFAANVIKVTKIQQHLDHIWQRIQENGELTVLTCQNNNSIQRFEDKDSKCVRYLGAMVPNLLEVVVHLLTKRK